ncbi:site-specific integrase [Spirillospora sp. NPDC052269]
MDPVIAEQLGRDHPLAQYLDDFLTDQKNANASTHTVRAYRGDLLQFTAHCDGELAGLTADSIRAFLADIGELSAATRKRKRAAVSSFCRWAVRQDRLDANPMDKIDTIKVSKSLPRPADTTDVARVLNSICSRRPRKDVPLDRLRDRVLFETIYVCGSAPPKPAASTSKTSTCARTTNTSASTARAAPSAPCSWTTAATSPSSSST